MVRRPGYSTRSIHVYTPSEVIIHIPKVITYGTVPSSKVIMLPRKDVTLRTCSAHYLNTQAVVMCYDITNYDSFQNLDDWYRLVVRTFAKGTMPYVAMVGNKCEANHKKKLETV